MKFKFVIVFALMVILDLELAFASGPTLTLKGNVGESEIQMTFTKEGESISGSYFYEKYKRAIRVNGAVQEREITINEFDDKGNQTGVFKGSFVSDSKIEGFWSRPDGSKQISFSLVLNMPANGVILVQEIKNDSVKPRKKTPKFRPRLMENSPVDICNYGTEGLNKEEEKIILSLLRIEGRSDLVSLNCRGLDEPNHLVVVTRIGSNLGDVYSIRLDERKYDEIAHGQFELQEVVHDESGAPFLLLRGVYMRQSPMYTSYFLLNFRTGGIGKIVEVYEDAVSGGCGPGEMRYDEPTASKINYFRLESRPDGLEELVFDISITDCATNKTKAKTVHFTPTRNGFVER